MGFWCLVVLMIWSPNLCELICFSSLSLPSRPENPSISPSLAFWNFKALAGFWCLISQCACHLSFSSVNCSQCFLDASQENLGPVFQLTRLLFVWYVAQLSTCFLQQQRDSSSSTISFQDSPFFYCSCMALHLCFLGLVILFAGYSVCLFLAFVFFNCLLIPGCQLIFTDED